MAYEVVGQPSEEEAMECIDALRDLLDEKMVRWRAILDEGITREDEEQLYMMLNGIGAAQWLSQSDPEERTKQMATMFRFAYCSGYERGRGNRPVTKWKVAEEPDEG